MENSSINTAINEIIIAIERNRNARYSDRDIFMNYGCIELRSFIHNNPKKLSNEDILYIYNRFCGDDYGFTIHGKWIKIKNKIINTDCIAKIQINHQEHEGHSELLATLNSSETINLIGHGVHLCYSEFLFDKILNVLK